MEKEELISYLTKEGYREIREVPGKGMCGLYPFMFTLGLVVGIDPVGYKYRYCYPKDKTLAAVIALKIWDGTGDPVGPWIKRKGEGGDFLNPNT